MYDRIFILFYFFALVGSRSQQIKISYSASSSKLLKVHSVILERKIQFTNIKIPTYCASMFIGSKLSTDIVSGLNLLPLYIEWNIVFMTRDQDADI